jgi:lipoate-protein ligase B
MMKFIRIKEPIEYHYGLMIMRRSLRDRVVGLTGDHVYFLEHKPVITIGRDGDIRNIMASQTNIPIFYVKRGGDVTLHAPGQLVIYPIIKLDERKLTLKDHILNLEETVIDVLRDYGLEGYWKKGTAGVWVGGRKIASIGVALDHWTTYHGLAFNISIDLRLFNLLRPCGLPPTEMTTLERELGVCVSFEDVFTKTVQYLSKRYGDAYDIEHLRARDIVNSLYG